ncbi:GNAT family N-acetyltransferase [Salinibacterium hongtaonis]|uniref:GNAT family N-acetyltransferase n=1 Tax=Homoserinimonas hongtaonis TaxID=2079791 RepID=UPI000D39AF7B|nr:GNAT family N-acetyltransferase [Salinibacterium hongtaonis]AWB88495.1 GNAT family N-acetyltransferase [Salinibacterium hongtaonis]
MTEFLIRAPHLDEVQELADLHLLTWKETYGSVFPPSAWGEEAREQRLAMWGAICSRPRPADRFAVAERDGKLIGFAGSGASTDDPPVRERDLFFIYVLATEQGSGVGQALLDAVVSDGPASLWVLEANPRARAFYERNGFVLEGARQATGFDTGGEEVRMVR